MKRWLDIFSAGFTEIKELSPQNRKLAEAIRQDLLSSPGYNSRVTLAQDVKMGAFEQLLQAIRKEAEFEISIQEQAGTPTEKAIGYGVESVVRFFQERYNTVKLSTLKSIGQAVVREGAAYED